MYGTARTLFRFGAAVLLLTGFLGLPDGAVAQAQNEAWQFGRDQLVVTGPRSLVILDNKGGRKELELNGNLAAVFANPGIDVALILVHDAQADANATAEPKFDPPFFQCDALLLTVPEGRWLAFPVTDNGNKVIADACGPHLAAAFSPDGKYTLLADYMEVAVTEQLLAALMPVEGMRMPPAPKNRSIVFDEPACGGAVDFASFYWVDDEKLGFDYGACGVVMDMVFDAARGISKVTCSPARQKPGYDCPADLIEK